jgi:4-amino-4-deoxy-L-arabinose transferase-like glycosyltransferase
MLAGGEQPPAWSKKACARTRTSHIVASVGRPRLLVTVLLLTALCLRLGAVAATPDLDTRGGDVADYDRHGRSLAAGHGYPDSVIAPAGGPTALRPPAYPFFLGGIYAITSNSVDAARIAQALVGTVTVALIGLLALRLWGRREALAALALAAVYPPLIAFGSSLLSEALFIPFALGALLCILEHRRDQHDRWAIAAGILIGLAALTRANGLLLLIPTVLGLWTLRPRLSRRAAAAPAIALLAAILTVAPWTIRNALVLDEFVPVSLQAGYTLAGTYNDESRDDSTFPGAWRIPQRAYYPNADRRPFEEPELDRELRRLVRGYVGDHPGYVLEVAYRNTLRIFDLGEREYARRTYAEESIEPWLGDLSRVGAILILILAVAGAFTQAARRVPLWFWLAPALFWTVVFAAGFNRYRAPLDPFLLLLAAPPAAMLATGPFRKPARDRTSEAAD